MHANSEMECPFGKMFISKNARFFYESGILIKMIISRAGFFPPFYFFIARYILPCFFLLPRRYRGDNRREIAKPGIIPELESHDSP